MEGNRSPEMSVVLVTPDSYHAIHGIVSHLLAQTARDRLEIVIVAPSADRLGLDEEELGTFHRFLVVEVGPITSMARARAAGIRKATAPLVALTEDHSYPEPGWAAALIEAHRQPWAAVGPVVGNANPHSTISWAGLFIEYAPFLDPIQPLAVEHLPGHQSSYKRWILLEYGPELEAMLEAESVLHWDLRARGFRLSLESSARTNHLNISSLVPWMMLRYYSARGFAAARSRSWSLPRRLLYAGGSPLIPWVRLWRILGQVRRSRRHLRLLPRVLPALVFGLILSGVGEMVGYARRAGDSRKKLAALEFDHLPRLSNPSQREVLAT